MNSAFKILYTAPSRKLRKLLNSLKISDDLFVLILAFIIGIIIGFAAIGARSLILSVSNFFFPGSDLTNFDYINAPWYKRLFIPILGGFILIPIYYFYKNVKGISLHNIFYAIHFKDGRIEPNTVITKTVATAATIGSGFSAGRETPIIHISAAIASTIGQLLKLPGNKIKTLALCGTAAGISAAFNTPIAGAIFVAEILSLEIPSFRFSAIITASLMGAITSKLFDPYPLGLFIPEYTYIGYQELLLYPILGLLSGIISSFFLFSLFRIDDLLNKKIKINPLFLPILGGFFIGLTALFFPQIMGIGYKEVQTIILSNNLIWFYILILIFIKILATSVTLGVGGSGGTLSPSIFVGALIGFLYFQLVKFTFPDPEFLSAGFILAGMSGLIAGTLRAPITSIIIIFELSGNINLVIPLFFTAGISYLISKNICKHSIFTFKLDNVNFVKGIDLNILKQIKVSEVYNKEFEAVNVSDNFSLVLSRLLRNKNQDLLVIDSRGEPRGIIIADDLKGSAQDSENLQQLLNAGEIAETDFKNLTLNDNCLTALNFMKEFGLNLLPVVNLNTKRIIGTLYKNDIIDYYYKKIETYEHIYDISKNFELKKEFDKLPSKIGFTITEIVPPMCMVGKSISSINLKENFSLDIYAIKQNLNNNVNIITNFPDDYILNEKDSLVIGGDIRNIRRFITTKYI